MLSEWAQSNPVGEEGPRERKLLRPEVILNALQAETTYAESLAAGARGATRL
jgi:hypothetical protein